MICILKILTLNKKEKNKLEKFWRFFIAIIAVALIILIAGWFFKQEKERQRIEEKEKKLNRLKEIKEKIKILQTNKKRIELIEKRILITARILIGVILIAINYFFGYDFIHPFNLSRIIDINEAVLLGYAFIAFITYGSIDNFVFALKSKVVHVLRKNHIESLEELEILLKEEIALNEEIKNLDNSIE